MSRDEQFAGWASAALSKMFEATGGHTHSDLLDLGSEDAQHAMLQTLARAAYDLVEHTLYCNGISPKFWPGGEEYGQASDIYLREIAKQLSAIPDMPVLPEENNPPTA